MAETPKKISGHRDFLEQEGFTIASPVTGSMRPIIRPNRDVVVLRRIERPLRRYDVVAYSRTYRSPERAAEDSDFGQNKRDICQIEPWRAQDDVQDSCSARVFGPSAEEPGKADDGAQTYDALAAVERTILHRVIGWRETEGERVYRIRGDAEMESEIVPESRVFAVMEGLYRGERYVSCESLSYRAASRLVVTLHPWIRVKRRIRARLSRIPMLKRIYRVVTGDHGQAG